MQLTFTILLSITSLLMPILTYKLGIKTGKRAAMHQASGLFRNHQSYLSHDR